jgi:hypothetical protein
MVFIASIERSLVRAAEKDRYIPIEMKKDRGRRPEIPGVEEAKKLNLEYTAYALWAAFKAKDLLQKLPPIPNYQPRLVEGYSAPLSMMALVNEDPSQSLKDYLGMILAERKNYAEGEIPDDEEALLDAILTSVVSAPDTDNGRTVYSRRSIEQLIEEGSVHRKDLGAYGVKICKDGLFIVPEIIERMLLKDSDWKGLNTKSILMRIPGAEQAQRRITRVSKNGIRGILLKDWKKNDGGDSETFKDM